MPPSFVVIVDTNICHSGRPDQPLSKSLKSAIASVPSGVIVKWRIPPVARLEREHEMVNQAREALSGARALAALAKQQFEINEGDLERLCVEALDQALPAASIDCLPMNPKSVDLDKLVHDAVYRRPPFKEGTEAGFRDRMILETVDQFLEGIDPPEAEVIFVTEDKTFASAARQHYEGNPEIVVVRHLGAVA